MINVHPGVVERVIANSDRRRAFSGYGNAVVVHHPDEDTWALYAHLDRVEVAQGQHVAAGTRLGTMGASTNGKFPGMGPHLHLEVRRRASSGGSPFPGPYPRSPQQPFSGMNPRPWLEGKGLRFLGRGGFEIVPGSPMAQTTHLFQGPGMAGITPRFSLPAAAPGLGAFAEVENEYEPVRFDRDVHFGLTPLEWSAAGATVLLTVSGGVALWVRKRRRRRQPQAA